jgi:aspartate aminotransferase
MLNSPCNPTGAAYTADELSALLALARQREWWVISDEIYVPIAYDAPAARSLQLAESRERLVVIDGVAKAYAMTGWRIGWSITQKPLAAAMSAFQSHTTSNAAAVSQHAALAALTDGAAADAAVAAMVAQFRSRRDAALAVLAEDRDIRVVRPDGAFYLFIEAPGAGRGEAAGDAFAATLLETHDVAAVPGAAFLTPDWIRVSYAAAEDLVLEGVRRIVAAHRAHR